MDVEIRIGAQVIQRRLAEHEVIEDGHAVALGEKGGDEDGAKVAGAAGDEDGEGVVTHKYSTLETLTRRAKRRAALSQRERASRHGRGLHAIVQSAV